MKDYNKKFELIIGAIGLLLETFIITFMILYLAYPELLSTSIDSSTGVERDLLQTFASELESMSVIIYTGFLLTIMQWVALFQIRKPSTSKTIFWALFPLLGSLYAYFYFGGLWIALMLFLFSATTITKVLKNK